MREAIEDILDYGFAKIIKILRKEKSVQDTVEETRKMLHEMTNIILGTITERRGNG
jgi:hypothetical protein